jgi:MoxR-like ATPase
MTTETTTETMTNWKLFYGDGRDPQEITPDDFPEPPPWRKFRQFDQMTKEQQQEIDQRWRKIQELGKSPDNDQGRRKGETFRLSQSEKKETARRVIEGVNAAIYLRRTLLITGRPGAGKTSLAYAIAHQLSLGPVLTWPITARSNLKDGLSHYDAIGRLEEVELERREQELRKNPFSKRDCVVSGSETERQPGRLSHKTGFFGSWCVSPKDIGQYITLGPVGTAFLPSQLPRVLLIDEIDKSDINLPNDLLNLFEEGWFRIPQLVRLAKESSEPVQVQTADKGIEAKIYEGQVTCCAFPIVVMTSNGERDFPAAFLRRCLRVKMPDPEPEDLKEIIASHFAGQEQYQKYVSKLDELIKEFQQDKNRATDQLLNMIHLLTQENLPEAEAKTLRELVFKSLTSED